MADAHTNRRIVEECDSASLEVDDLYAGYGDDSVIRGVSVSVREGELVAILGPNGAGKSTLLKALMGIASVHRGRIRFQGVDVTGHPEYRLARLGIGYVPQIKDVFDSLTVLENLQMGGYLLDRHKVAERVEETILVFPQLGVLLKKSASRISGGERKMVAIGRVLMLKPKLLVLDEPTASLSARLAESLLEDHMTRLVQGGTSILLVEQRARAALKVANYAYIMVGGELAIAGEGAVLLAEDEVRQRFLGVGAKRTMSSQ
jgi:ABC-type branched-subunit amino acid transport system ATPase component